MIKPDISVIIPTYRRPRELAETVASVLAQPDVTTETIVIDDCPDGSAESVMRSFHSNGVVYLRNIPPSGGRPAAVRNFGWTLANADLIHFLDDDDLVPTGYYAAARNALAENPSVGVAFGAIEPFGTFDLTFEEQYFLQAARRARRLKLFGAKLALAAEMFFSPTLLVCSAAMIRKSCIAPLGGFNVDLPLVEDVDFYARAIRKFGAVVLDRTSIRYRIGTSLMRQPDRVALINKSYTKIHANYRADHSVLDYIALKGLARLLKAIPC